MLFYRKPDQTASPTCCKRCPQNHDGSRSCLLAPWNESKNWWSCNQIPL